MDAQIIYQFNCQQDANRFLNAIKSGAVAGAKGGLCQGGMGVRVRYPLAADGRFAVTAQQLDDLAARSGGQERS